MSHTITGTAGSFSKTTTAPDDGDAEVVASVNTPFQALLNNTVDLDARAWDLRAARASDAQAVAVQPSGTFRGHYSAARREWYLAGVSDMFIRSRDPFHFPATTEISVGAQFGVGGMTTFDFDVAPNGDVVILTDTIDGVQEWNAAGPTWTKHTGTLGNDPDQPSIRYAVTQGWWVAAYRYAAGPGTAVATSTDRGATWTNRTMPAGMPAGATVVISSDGAGVLVMQGFNSTNVYFSRSTDGGVTWSAVVTKALGVAPEKAGDANCYARPVWNGSVWLACASHVGSGAWVWTSPDGLTWTQTAHFTDATISLDWYSAIGGVMIAMLTDGTREYLAVSTDAGVTWKYGDVAFKVSGAARPATIVRGSQRFIFPGISTSVWIGSACAGPVTAVT